MERLPQVLICDDDSITQLATKSALKGRFECRIAKNSEEALVIVRNHTIDIVLLDIQMRTPREGLDCIPRLLEADPTLVITMMSGITDYKVVKEALQLGASDYIDKQTPPEGILTALLRMLSRRELHIRSEQRDSENRTHQSKHQLVGNSPSIVSLRKSIDKIKKSQANVLIFGETGTGKEVVARQLRGQNPDGSLVPFVSIDSATIQSSTAESQLFGHEKGAFTGADKTKKGLFEEADGGVVYFDEVANMPLPIQAKLLRVLQEKEVTRLGSSKTIPLQFRVICATNKNLEELCRKGEFMEDLFQRMHVLPIDLEPLRSRSEDIPLLISHFLKQQPSPIHRFTFTPEAITCLQNYPWPGNVRELGNVIAYVGTLSDGPEIDIADLPPRFRTLSAPSTTSKTDTPETFYEEVARFETQILKKAYEKSEGNIAKMAVQLGMDRSHLHTKLKQYGIHTPRNKTPKTSSEETP